MSLVRSNIHFREKLYEVNNGQIKGSEDVLFFQARRDGTNIFVYNGTEIDGNVKEYAAVYAVSGKPAVILHQNGKDVVFFDGNMSRPYDEIPTTWTYRNNGTVLDFVARDQNKYYIVEAGGKEYGPYDQVLASYVMNTRYAHVVQDGGSQSVVIQGVKGPAFDSISSLTIIDDDAFYIGKRGSKMFVIKNQEELGEYDTVWIPPPSKYTPQRPFVVSQDGNAAYFTVQNQTTALIVNGKIASNSFDEVSWALKDDKSAFWKDGKPVFVGRKNGRYLVVVGFEEGKQYDEIQSVAIVDGHLVYIARDAGKEFIVIDGVEGTRYDSVSPFRQLCDKIGFTVNDKNKVYLVQIPL